MEKKIWKSETGYYNKTTIRYTKLVKIIKNFKEDTWNNWLGNLLMYIRFLLFEFDELKINRIKLLR